MGEGEWGGEGGGEGSTLCAIYHPLRRELASRI